VLGDVDAFERAVRLVIEDVSFDTDVVVSVFETNIRVLGSVSIPRLFPFFYLLETQTV